MHHLWNIMVLHRKWLSIPCLDKISTYRHKLVKKTYLETPRYMQTCAYMTCINKTSLKQHKKHTKEVQEEEQKLDFVVNVLIFCAAAMAPLWCMLAASSYGESRRREFCFVATVLTAQVHPRLPTREHIDEPTACRFWRGQLAPAHMVCRNRSLPSDAQRTNQIHQLPSAVFPTTSQDLVRTCRSSGVGDPSHVL
jgi:hypothetical protein